MMQKLTPIQAATLATFWSKSRRCYVTLTRNDILVRGGDPKVANELKTAGLIESSTDPTTSSTRFYNITEKGKSADIRKRGPSVAATRPHQVAIKRHREEHSAEVIAKHQALYAAIICQALIDGARDARDMQANGLTSNEAIKYQMRYFNGKHFRWLCGLAGVEHNARAIEKWLDSPAGYTFNEARAALTPYERRDNAKD